MPEAGLIVEIQVEARASVSIGAPLVPGLCDGEKTRERGHRRGGWALAVPWLQRALGLAGVGGVLARGAVDAFGEA